MARWCGRVFDQHVSGGLGGTSVLVPSRLGVWVLCEIATLLPCAIFEGPFGVYDPQFSDHVLLLALHMSDLSHPYVSRRMCHAFIPCGPILEGDGCRMRPTYHLICYVWKDGTNAMRMLRVLATTTFSHPINWSCR